MSEPIDLFNQPEAPLLPRKPPDPNYVPACVVRIFPGEWEYIRLKESVPKYPGKLVMGYGERFECWKVQMFKDKLRIYFKKL